MKKNIYSLFLVLIALAGFTACSDDKDYQWASVPAGDQVYFSKDLPTQQALSKKASSFTIPVNRVKTDAATTVNISLTSEDNFLSAPSSVQFAAGQATADLVINYDPEALVYDVFKKASLAITTEGVTTPYGASTYNFTAGVLSPYKSIGMGSFTDTYFMDNYYTVEILQNEEQPNVFRVKAPYATAIEKELLGYGYEQLPHDDYLQITVMKPGDVLRDIQITRTDLVYYDIYATGVKHPSYDPVIWLVHPSAFSACTSEDYMAYNKIIGYKEDGSIGAIQLAPYHYMDGVGGWNHSQADGYITIIFPGYSPKDYSATLTATGIFTDLAGNVFAQAITELGDDATNAKAVVIEADADPEAVADAIVAGELEAYDVTSSGVINVPIPEGVSGKLQIVLVVIDENGAVKTVCASNFEYYGGAASPWKSIGIGILTDNLFITMYSPDGENAFDAQTYEVEIEENNENPGLYRLVDPFKIYADAISYMNYTPANLEINATDPEAVYIEMQATGIDDGDGMTYIASTGGYYLQTYDVATLKENGYFGTLKDGVITLPQFPVKDDEGNVKYTYQGIFAQGTSTYSAGTSSEFKLVMPEAVSSAARAKAAKRAMAQSFARHLNAYNKVSFKQLKTQMNLMARPNQFKMIAE